MIITFLAKDPADCTDPPTWVTAGEYDPFRLKLYRDPGHKFKNIEVSDVIPAGDITLMTDYVSSTEDYFKS